MRHAFSLIELSIVLVILGLLVGGILAGQSLIRASELRSVSSEFQEYQTAMATFRDKYFALPGDMTNATNFWGSTTCANASTTAATCNGDGNGQLTTSASGTGSNELYRYWQHLSNAGLIEGFYDGITHGGTAYTSTIANSPSSKLNGGLYFIIWRGVLGAGYMFQGSHQNVMSMGGFKANDSPDTPLLRPEEAWNLDVKMDDGLPARGKLIAYQTLTTCTTAANYTALDAPYRLDSTAFVCVPAMRNIQ